MLLIFLPSAYVGLVYVVTKTVCTYTQLLTVAR